MPPDLLGFSPFFADITPPALPSILTFLGNTASTLAEVATFVGIAVFVLTLLSPTLAGRLLGWWHKRLAIRAGVEAAMIAGAAHPAVASAAPALPPTVDPSIAAAPSLPAVPPFMPPAPPATAQAPMPVQPGAIAGPAASIPAPLPAAPASPAAAGRTRVPRYRRVWWLLAVTEIVTLAAFALGISNGDLSWLTYASITVAFGMTLALAGWAVSASVRLQRFGWAWGIGISSIVLVFFGPLGLLPILLFALVGPTPTVGKLSSTHPKAAWVAIATVAITVLSFGMAGAGEGIVGQSYDPVAGTFDMASQAYNTGVVVLGAGTLIWLLGLLIGLGLTIWVIVKALTLRHWGWALSALLVGYLPFTLNGPTTKRLPTQPSHESGNSQ